MAMQLKKAQRSKAYLKLGIAAPSGGGKTFGSLLIGYGLMKEKYPTLSDDELWGKIAIIDTENGSGELYVGSETDGLQIKAYNAVTIDPDYTVGKYIQALQTCEDAGMEVVIIDSMTHAWSGEGGLLDKQNAIAKKSGNTYTAWKDVTPDHTRLVNKILQTPMHIIATMRSKQEYVQERNEQTGKNAVRKLGMEPEQRKGMEYEFTTFIDVDEFHKASTSKDRTSLFDGKIFTISPDTGKEFMRWLSTGVDTAHKIVAESSSSEDKKKELIALQQKVVTICGELGGSKNLEMMELIKSYDPEKKNGNPNSIKDIDTLNDLYSNLVAMKNNQE